MELKIEAKYRCSRHPDEEMWVRLDRLKKNEKGDIPIFTYSVGPCRRCDSENFKHGQWDERTT